MRVGADSAAAVGRTPAWDLTMTRPQSQDEASASTADLSQLDDRTLVAAFLDGIDGRVARFLKSTSRFGAELDSLTDFLCFGVAPAMLLYVWALNDLRSLGWIAAMIFAICSALRAQWRRSSPSSRSATRCCRRPSTSKTPARVVISTTCRTLRARRRCASDSAIRSASAAPTGR